jgi:hypothetical protein
MPTVGLPPTMLFTLQMTAVFVVPVTVAMNCRVAPIWTVAEVGEMATAMGAVIVTVAEADLAGSAALVAFTVTRLGLGAVAGAV